MELVLGMLDELETKLPTYSHPVIHSDQGSQYQSPTYQARLEKMDQFEACPERETVTGLTISDGPIN